MTMDDDLERRLRDALTTPRAADSMDVDAFLSDVHRGARARRVRRTASVALGAALLVTGGGFAVNASGLIGGSSTPIAGNRTDVHASSGSEPVTGSGTTAPPPAPISISPKGPISAKDVTPLSLTATGTEHQWILAKTPGHDCGRAVCATIFSTDMHGESGHWADLGQLPVPAASGDNPKPDSVSGLRFTKRTDGSGIYDGWAYGDALWSTHDSGATWSAAASPPGQVTELESWGSDVYAAVRVAAPDQGGASTGGPASEPGTEPGLGTASGTTSGTTTPPSSQNTDPATVTGTTLYRSPATSDDWTPVDVGHPLSDVTALAAAEGVVALLDRAGAETTLYISADGVTWEPQQPCPAGTEPGSLSTAGDSTTGVAALWVTCSNATTTVVRFMDTDAWGTWTPAQGTFGGGAMIAARTPDEAMVAGTGVQGIQQITATDPPVQVYSGTVGAPVFFGFTNANYGYLLDSSGKILSTTDGGAGWSPYQVSDTKP
jgi:hypothetical protein